MASSLSPIHDTFYNNSCEREKETTKYIELDEF